MSQTCNLPLDRSLPLVCICSLFSFLSGVGIGANDLSASFAMVVGSGSLNMRQAIVYCTVFELLGAAFMGGHISGTIRKGIVDPLLFTMDRDKVIIGMTCASFSSALWLYLSTVFGLPVSITHTVVGSIIGFAFFSHGSFKYVQSAGVVKILISWLLAPLVACIVTAGIFYVLRKCVLQVKGRSFQNALLALPYCLAFSLLIDLFFIIIERPPILTVTVARFVPLGVQYLLMFLAIIAGCWLAASVLFPRLAVEAWELRTFVWEAPLLRTEAEDGTHDVASLKEAATAAVEEKPVNLSFLSSSKREEAAAKSHTEQKHKHHHQEQENTPLPRRVAAMLHEPSSFLLQKTGPDEVHLRPHSNVRATPVLRPLGSSAISPEDIHKDSKTPTPSVSYGTLDIAKVNVASPVTVEPNDSFIEEDWGIDHPMQPTNFRGLLIKPFNPRAEYLFTSLQVVAGSMSSFVHGAVAGANATAAFVILYDSFVVGELQEEPLGTRWTVLPAMFGIAIGMFSLGARLMKTVGMELVTVTPARGWCIQAGSTLVTMVLTGIGIPVSLSQAQVGAAIGCGLLDARSRGVGWGIVAKIAGGWVVTLAISAGTTGATMWLLAFFYCG